MASLRPSILNHSEVCGERQAKAQHTLLCFAAEAQWVRVFIWAAVFLKKLGPSKTKAL